MKCILLLLSSNSKKKQSLLFLVNSRFDTCFYSYERVAGLLHIRILSHGGYALFQVHKNLK